MSFGVMDKGTRVGASFLCVSISWMSVVVRSRELSGIGPMIGGWFLRREDIWISLSISRRAIITLFEGERCIIGELDDMLRARTGTGVRQFSGGSSMSSSGASVSVVLVVCCTLSGVVIDTEPGATAVVFDDVTAMVGSTGAVGVAIAVDVIVDDAAVVVTSEVVTDGWTDAAVAAGGGSGDPGCCCCGGDC